GDCAVIRDAHGRPYGQTAQNAIGEAKALADNLVRALDGLPALPCDIRTRGSLAALGDHRGGARIGHYRFTGVRAWLINRLYYLWAIPAWSRKVKIAFDWLLDLALSRDYVQLGVHKAPRPAEDKDRAA